jgi:hypothetical protein
VKFSRGFKIAYWLALIGVLTWFLLLRVTDAVAGHATAADTIVFAVWIALLLAPLFTEVELLGIKLKQEVEKAKDELKREIVALKTDITSAIDVRTHVSPNIYLSPPADAALPTIEAQVKRAVEQALASTHAPPSGDAEAVRQVDDDIVFLFRTRRDLEVELRRIAQERQIPLSGRPLGGIQMARALAQSEILEPDLERAIRDVYSICSPAVHGVPVTPAQVSFVRDVGPQLLKALRTIH